MSAVKDPSRGTGQVAQSEESQCLACYLGRSGKAFFFCLKRQGHSGPHRSDTGHHWDESSKRTCWALAGNRLQKLDRMGKEKEL